MVEVEVKIGVEDVFLLEKNLVQCGFIPGDQVREEDCYFNSPSYNLRERDKALRIRWKEHCGTKEREMSVTYKGPKLDNRSMTRQEIEMEISDAEAMKQIFLGMGFFPLPAVCKTRQYFHRDQLTACMDHVDGLGYFLELELLIEEEKNHQLALERIEQVLKELGLDSAQTTRTSYLSMLEKKFQTTVKSE